MQKQVELIYLYLGNINRQLQDQGIHFGNRFRVVYNSQERDLTITKCKDEQPCIYGEHFRSFDLLVGRNVTGKSTILNLLGLPQQSRYSVLPNSSGYRKSLQQLLQTQDGPLLRYGVILEPSKFQNEVLSKAVYDTIYHN